MGSDVSQLRETAMFHLLVQLVKRSAIVADEGKNEGGLGSLFDPTHPPSSFSLCRSFLAVYFFAPFYQLQTWNKLPT